VETTVLRGGPPDVIAYAFYRMGFRPRESLILVGLQGPGRLIGLVIRVDLPPRRQLRPALVRQLDVLRRAGEDSVVVLVVSDAQPDGDQTEPIALPHRGLVRDLLDLAADRGWWVQDVIAVSRSRWRSYLCVDPACCPPDGHPLEMVMDSAAAASMVCLGRVLATDENALVADVEATVAEPQPVGDGSRAVQAASPADPAQLLRRWRLLLQRASAPDALPDVSWLVPALQDRWLRDAVLLTMVPDCGTAPEELLAGADDAVLDGMFDRCPDPELLERGRRVLSAVARSAPSGERVDALALLAWMSWWSGDGARGRLLSTRALADGPGHRLARLVDGLLRLGVPPTWATTGGSGSVSDCSGWVDDDGSEYPDDEMGCR
jgi:Domain of unknown function (DUF4192)